MTADADAGGQKQVGGELQPQSNRSCRKLAQLHDLLIHNKNGRRFSMIYFSDHGMAHRDIDGITQLNNNFVSKYHHDVPLVKISSDDSSRKVLNSQKSGLMFVNGLAICS